jgi:hypothetical protein
VWNLRDEKSGVVAAVLEDIDAPDVGTHSRLSNDADFSKHAAANYPTQPSSHRPPESNARSTTSTCRRGITTRLRTHIQPGHHNAQDTQSPFTPHHANKQVLALQDVLQPASGTGDLFWLGWFLCLASRSVRWEVRMWGLFSG